MQQKKRALGRGLEALLPSKPKTEANTKTESVAMSESAVALAEPPEDLKPVTLPITAIRRNEAQPRQYFDEEALHQLADSIKRHGIIQPVAVMPRENDYVLVAGERRYRAAQLAGIRELPVVILEPLSDAVLLEYALVENLQREDLNPVEEARAYLSLQKTFDLSAEEIADRVGKSRPAIANALRLLTLPAHMLEDVESGRITAGHARAILSLESGRDQVALRDLIVMDNLSVRQAELKSREMVEGGAARRGKAKPANAKKRNEHDNVRQVREQLVDILACKVNVSSPDGQRGKIEIYFESLDELQHVLNHLGVET